MKSNRKHQHNHPAYYNHFFGEQCQGSRFEIICNKYEKRSMNKTGHQTKKGLIYSFEKSYT